ncbi:hypothetical protein ACGRHY_27975 [Streptomyces sp. HK10]|uniref:hypothetical protein n=1 Tax=Streptomyces sp. HK10 TaxID=3373255 RepID=UPI003748672E
MTNGETKKTAMVTVQPAATWPTYEADHARAELAAMQMLVAGTPLPRIKQRTHLSWAHLKRLAELVAEEAQNPAKPRNVLRDRRPRRPARIRVVPKPAHGLISESNDIPKSESTASPPPEPRALVDADSKPEQLSLICI